MAATSILIVEDDPMNVQLVRALLSGASYDLKLAESAEEAVTVLETFKPSLILMDMQLPGQSGLDLTRQLRTNPDLNNTSIVVLTGYARKGVEENCLRAGADGYIVKPIDVSTFGETVKSFIDRRKPTAQESTGDIRDLLRSMRNNFLVEVRAELTKLLSLDHTPEESRLVVVLHRWAGIAGTLGMTNVTDVSRRLEAHVESTHEVDSPTVREGLEEIDRLVSVEAASQVADLPLAGNIVNALSGKRIGLAGFAEGEAKRLAKALDRAQSFTLMMEAPADGLSEDAVGRFDIIILNLCSGTGVACHKNTSTSIDKPVLLIASRTEVSDDILTIDNPNRDFLIAPWDAEGLMVRCCKLLAKSPIPTPIPKREGPLQILIADDDPTVTTLLTAALRRSGAHCHIARTGVDALAMTRDLLPDAVVLDVNMPGMGGFEVLSLLRGDDKTAKLPIVLLTARVQEADVLKGFSLGASDYITKPFNPMEFAARVARYLPRN